MSRVDRQMANQRANFDLALKRSRCPKDNGKVLEVSMPEVVCEKCSTYYILATQSGTFTMHWKLVEKQAAPAAIPSTTIMKEKEVIQREIVKVPCKFCGNLNDLASAKFCSGCGAPVK